MNTLAEVAAYCAANIVDWDEKTALALCMIGRHDPIDPGFRDEIEDAVREWAEDNEYSIDEWDDDSAIDAEEIILCGD